MTEEEKRNRRRARRRLAAVRNAALIILLLLIVAGYFVWDHFFAYGKDKADLNAYFGVSSETDFPVIIDGENTGMHVTERDGAFYIASDDLPALSASRFYIDENAGTILYTTTKTTWTAPFNSNAWTTDDGRSGSLEKPLSIAEDGVLYVNLDYIRALSPLRYSIYRDPNRIRMELNEEEIVKTAATVSKKTELRLLGGIKSEILKTLVPGERVYIVDEMENWSKVKTTDAFTGYVEKKFLTDTGEDVIEAVRSELQDVHPEELTYTRTGRDFKICLAWHALYGSSGTDTIDSFASVASPMNVIAPTWISASDNDGNIKSNCDANYIMAARSKGLEVWATFDNFNAGDIDTTALLKNGASRAALINNLMNLQWQYGFEGINVDIEQLKSEASAAYLQFMRELAVKCDERGVMLSVDVPPPLDFNSHYGYAELGRVCDYVILMGYDEHYRTSPVAGSVASINYVRDGIEGLKASVPVEKIINALPFYTRFWISGGGEGMTSVAKGIKEAAQTAEGYGINLSWDEETGQNYGEAAQDDGTLVQVWMEDERSIEEKLSVMESLGVTQVGAWRLGFENEGIWNEIAAFLER